MGTRIPVAVIGTGWWATAYHLPALVATAGVHVLVEKPVATSVADAYELVRLADDRGMQLIVGYTSQFGAAALGVRQWLRDDMGELVTVSVEFTSRMVPLFEGRDDPRTQDAPIRPPTVRARAAARRSRS